MKILLFIDISDFDSTKWHKTRNLMGVYTKNKGLPVEYNTVFYDVNGCDADGNAVRNFDLLKAFSTLVFPVASRRKCMWYNRLFPYYGYSAQEWTKDWWTAPPSPYSDIFICRKKYMLPFVMFSELRLTRCWMKKTFNCTIAFRQRLLWLFMCVEGICPHIGSAMEIQFL